VTSHVLVVVSAFAQGSYTPPVAIPGQLLKDNTKQDGEEGSFSLNRILPYAYELFGVCDLREICPAMEMEAEWIKTRWQGVFQQAGFLGDLKRVKFY